MQAGSGVLCTVRFFGMDIQVSLSNKTISSATPGSDVLQGKPGYFFRLSVLWYLVSTKEIDETGRPSEYKRASYVIMPSLQFCSSPSSLLRTGPRRQPGTVCPGIGAFGGARGSHADADFSGVLQNCLLSLMSRSPFLIRYPLRPIDNGIKLSTPVAIFKAYCPCDGFDTYL